MNSRIIVPSAIITVDSEDRILTGHALEVSDGIIKRIFRASDIKEKNAEYYNDLVLIPGFIQTHVHLCQTLFRGIADDLALLDWLQYRIFPYENAHNKDSLKAAVRLGLYELLKSGTTTILDMGTLRHQEIIFDELIRSGIRAFAGKCMMDKNDLFPSFKSSTDDELKNTHALAAEFHNKNEKIRYGFAPRFVLSSSETLLTETSEMMKDFQGSVYHTHSSENKDEGSRVREMFGCGNIEYFDRVKVLNGKTVLAHCVHVNKNEIDILAERKVAVAHCPSSNLKLGSGIAPVPDFIKKRITVSLGSDGAPCNNNLSQFQEMRLSSLIQKPLHGAGIIDARTIFRMSNIEGARALGIENETGSIEEGKKADLLLVDLSRHDSPLTNGENLYSDLVFSANANSVKKVMVSGEWIVENGEVSGYDEKEIISSGRSALVELLRRV